MASGPEDVSMCGLEHFKFALECGELYDSAVPVVKGGGNFPHKL
jgi:hypothetical protein